MTLTEMSQAIQDARAQLNRADTYTGDMAALIAGRLRKSTTRSYVLTQLKRELSRWNIHTSSWKEEK